MQLAERDRIRAARAKSFEFDMTQDFPEIEEAITLLKQEQAVGDGSVQPVLVARARAR